MINSTEIVDPSGATVRRLVCGYVEKGTAANHARMEWAAAR